ncbi:MAG: glycerate kinase [Actinomycetales bacterium]|nr:glycerate kinase [Actinomycetales bacterium]
MTRVVLAPNAFKGSLGAAGVATAMAAGSARVLPSGDFVLRPMADGGDGSVDAFVASGFTRAPVVTRGPTGEPGAAALARHGKVVVVELASACGMARLPGGLLAPMTSSTAGLGDAIRAALDHGAAELIVCIGGSASTDGGAGMLAALGARLLDERGDPVTPMGSTLGEVAVVDLSAIDSRLADISLTVAADVTAPLLGPDGAAATFGPQKGATAEEVERLEDGLTRWSRALARAVGHDVADLPGAGAAGGTGAALLALGATSAPGAELIGSAIGLEPSIESADVVLTGEGRLDRQTALGKGAGWVAALSRQSRVPVGAVCGTIDLSAEDARGLGLVAWADCRSRAVDADDAMARAAELVADAAAEVVERMASLPPRPAG